MEQKFVSMVCLVLMACGGAVEPSFPGDPAPEPSFSDEPAPEPPSHEVRLYEPSEVPDAAPPLEPADAGGCRHASFCKAGAVFDTVTCRCIAGDQ